MCTHTCMTTKTITIMDDTYKMLLRNKMRNESFSDVIRRILTKEKSILDFAGAWSEVSDKDAESMKKNIILLRKRSTKELIENDLY